METKGGEQEAEVSIYKMRTNEGKTDMKEE